MERPGPGSHFKHSHVRVQYGVVCSFIGLHASRHHNNDNNNLKKITHAWPHEQKNMCSSVQKKTKNKNHTPTVHLLYQSTLIAWKKRPQQSLSLFIRSWVHTHTVHTHTLTHSHWGAWCKCHSGLRWLLCWLCTLGGCSRKGCIQFLELREGGRNETCCMLCCSTAS